VASGSSSSAYGAGASASGANSTAFGAGSSANASSATAFGQGSSANFSNSAAFGAGATATAANQQVFGTATNTYTMPGIGTAASQAAQVGPLELVTADANGNIAARPLSLVGFVTFPDLEKVQSEAFDGIATAFAMAGTPWLSGDEKFAVSVNWGYFQGHNGFAASGAVKIAKHVQFNGAFGIANHEGIPGGRVGLRLGW
jgi:autotransporter adhesin